MAEHSWQPIDLTTLPPKPARTPAPSNLYYPGARHLWSGEPESGKSWAAVIATTNELDQGNSVLYLDFEDDEYQAKERFDQLGVSQYDLANLVYMRPSDPYGAQGVRETIVEIYAANNVTMVIIDAYAGALDIHDMDSHKSADIEKFNRAVIDPLRRMDGTDRTTIIVDHVVKDRENRGRYASGSERKMGSVDVHLGFTVAKPFGHGRTGLFPIHVHKDRPGWLLRPTIGALELASDPDTNLVTWQIKPTASTDSDGHFRPTALMERLSRALEERDHATTRNDLLDQVKGRRKYLLTALDQLVSENYVHEENGARGARLMSSAKPYREALDDQFPTSSQQFPEPLATGSPTSPYGGNPQGVGNRSSQQPRNGSTGSRTDSTEQEAFAGDDDIPF